MTRPNGTDWTTGAPKWAAVILLGGASIFGMAWSVTMRRPLGAVGPAPVGPSQPAPVQEPSQPGRVILREESPGDSGAPVKSQSRPRSKPNPNPGKPALTSKLNINAATEAELELLPGIGPALAARIIEDRQAAGPFKTVGDLDRVKGIGPKTLDRIRDLCTVD